MLDWFDGLRDPRTDTRYRDDRDGPGDPATQAPSIRQGALEETKGRCNCAPSGRNGPSRRDSLVGSSMNRTTRNEDQVPAAGLRYEMKKPRKPQVRFAVSYFPHIAMAIWREFRRSEV